MADLCLSLSQGCGAETQISASGSSSRHQIFLVPSPDPTSESFCLRLQNNLFHEKTKTIVLCVQLACPTN